MDVFRFESTDQFNSFLVSGGRVRTSKNCKPVFQMKNGKIYDGGGDEWFTPLLEIAPLSEWVGLKEDL